MRYQGAGSSMINPTFLTTAKTAFEKHNINYKFCCGYAENSVIPDESLISEATNTAKDYDKVIVFAGLTDYV